MMGRASNDSDSTLKKGNKKGIEKWDRYVCVVGGMRVVKRAGMRTRERGGKNHRVFANATSHSQVLLRTRY